VDRGANLEARDDSGRTPSHIASYLRPFEVGRELINQGANILAKDGFNKTPTETSLCRTTWRNQNVDFQNCLLTRCQETVFQHNGRQSVHTILWEATFSDQFVFLGQLGSIKLDRGMTWLVSLCRRKARWAIRSPDLDFGDLPIHIACLQGAPFQLIRVLVDAEPERGTLQSRNKIGRLPIHMACLHESFSEPTLPKVVKMLVETGGIGTLSAQDVNGSLPLHLLCQNKHPSLEMVQILVEMGGVGTLSTRDAGESMPLHLLCQNKHHCLEAVKKLVEMGGVGTLSARDISGSLPLHFLCQNNQPSLEAVKYLLSSYPPALSVRTQSGDLPLTLAGKTASLDVIYELFRTCPDVVPQERNPVATL